MEGVLPLLGVIALLVGCYIAGKEQGKRESSGSVEKEDLLGNKVFREGLAYLLDRLGHNTEYIDKLKNLSHERLTDYLEALFDKHTDDVGRYYFREGWRKCEERVNQVDEDRAKLAEILKVNPHETDINVWKKAKREFMMAHHPDRNKWADPEFVASVNALYDKVFK